MSDQHCLPLARILLGQFGQNLPLPLMFPVSNFPPTDPTLPLGYKSHLPMLSSELSSISPPVAMIPIPISRVLSKVFVTMLLTSVTEVFFL